MRQPCKRAPQATPPISELDPRLISSRVSVRYRPRGISPGPTRLTSNPLGLARNGEREVQKQKETRKKRDPNRPGNDEIVEVTRRLCGVGRRGWAIRVSSAGGGHREMTRGDLALREKGLILWQCRRMETGLDARRVQAGTCFTWSKAFDFWLQRGKPLRPLNHKSYLHQS